MFTKENDLVDFSFDAQVADVFDDMVKRSVPGYQSMIEMVNLSVKTYGQDNTNYYDLGASTGATSIALGINNPHSNNQIIALDNSPDMVKKCQKNLSGKIDNVNVICGDILDMRFENASIIVLNLTLQFITPSNRQTLIDKIYKGLNTNGALIISEKIHFDNQQKQEQISRLHLDFKRSNGYSELEIANKRQSIENILITDSKQTHFKRFNTAGFKNSVCHFQCLNFVSFLSVK